MTRQVSQATLNTYWDYDNPALPTKYIRQSDLHFVTVPRRRLLSAGAPTPTQAVFFRRRSGWRADREPAARRADELLGYYLTYASDLAQRPQFLADGKRIAERVRYRLMEFRQPTEEFQVFARNLRSTTSTTPNDYYRWFSASRMPTCSRGIRSRSRRTSWRS